MPSSIQYNKNCTKDSQAQYGSWFTIVVLQSEAAKQLKAEANQACLIAARSSADLGKLHAGQG